MPRSGAATPSPTRAAGDLAGRGRRAPPACSTRPAAKAPPWHARCRPRCGPAPTHSRSKPGRPSCSTPSTPASPSRAPASPPPARWCWRPTPAVRARSRWCRRCTWPHSCPHLHADLHAAVQAERWADGMPTNLGWCRVHPRPPTSSRPWPTARTARAGCGCGSSTRPRAGHAARRAAMNARPMQFVPAADFSARAALEDDSCARQLPRRHGLPARQARRAVPRRRGTGAAARPRRSRAPARAGAAARAAGATRGEAGRRRRAGPLGRDRRRGQRHHPRHRPGAARAV